MNRQKRVVFIAAAISLVIGLLLGAGTVFLTVGNGASDKASQPDLRALYDAAVRDAAFAEEEEILPLVSLTKEDERVTWNEAGDRVLLCTWHNYPDSYPAGETVTLEWGAVWSFTPDELEEKYAAEVSSVTDWELRLKQLIGFPPDSVHSTFTTFWVDPKDVCRPANQPDPFSGTMQLQLDRETSDENYTAWFEDNILGSYFYGAYPWTRLGYTYDWADNGIEYGLSEFLIRQGAQVQVVDTKGTEEFLEGIAS